MLVVVVGALLATLGWRAAVDAWSAEPKSTIAQAMAFYGAWLLPLLAVLVVYSWRRRQVSLPVAIFSVLLLGSGMYARFIEPNMLLVKHTTIKTGYKLKLALISDLHYGLFSTPEQMQRLVDRLNSLDVDAVMVAGDWTHEPSRNISLTELLRPFSQIRHPVYSVPGNHDEEMPGPPLQQALRQALTANKVMPIEGVVRDLGQVRLVGVGDLWATGIGHMHEVVQTLADKPVLILTHNPDTFGRLPKMPQSFVVLAGHTHGGQVNLPYFTDKILTLVSEGHYQRGLYPLDHGQIFVTSGIGMVGLPLRFAMPPTIDVLEFE